MHIPGLLAKAHKHLDNIFMNKLVKQPFTSIKDLRVYTNELTTLYNNISLFFGGCAMGISTGCVPHTKENYLFKCRCFTAEELCFFRIVNTLNKYHRDPGSSLKAEKSKTSPTR